MLLQVVKVVTDVCYCYIFVCLLAARIAVTAALGELTQKNHTSQKKNDLHHDASHPTRPHYTSKCRHSEVIT